MALNIPFKYTKPFFHALDPETAHKATILALKTPFAPKFKPVDDPRLAVKLWNLDFLNPIGLSAGFDKNAEVVGPVFNLGFGFMEAGGVTIPPQAGLPRPRIFRDVKNAAIINRMNFPNVGVEQFKQNIQKFRKQNPNTKGIVGIQIAKSADQTEAEKDFDPLIKSLGNLADYIVFNISCPNSPGLADLQQRKHFMPLVDNIKQARKNYCDTEDPPPLIAKLSPDLDEKQQEELAQAALDSGLDGLILSNTTTTRPDYLDKDFRQRPGGLSGKPLTQKSTEIIGNFYQYTKGQIPIIGVGGVSSGEDAYDKIKAGASLIQLYSALVFHGPELVNKINHDLVKLLEQDGFTHLSEAVGSAHK